MIELNSFSIIILLGIFPGLWLVFSLNRIKERNKEANRFLAIFILLITCTMIGRFLVESKIDLGFIHLLAMPDAIIFLYGPVLYFYLQRLLWDKNTSRWWYLLHFGPATLFLISQIPSIMSETSTLHRVWVNYSYYRFIAIEGGAILHNATYLFLCMRLIKKYQVGSDNLFSFKQYPTYLKMIFNLIAISIVIWIVSYFSWVTGNYNIFSLIGYRTIWLILPFLIFTLGHFAMYQPNVFKLDIQDSQKGKQKPRSIDNEELSTLKEQLSNLMQLERPYLNSKLTLHELAGLMGVKPHLLSKVINTCFEKNFSDFVNEYRVNEFKQLVQGNKHQAHTILALAHEAGFNSKTTFNTAFKKLTHLTPVEFVNTITE